MRRRLALIAAAALLIVFAGCEKRDRNNPFDPGNPDTGGIPPLLDARAGNRETALSWNLESFEGVRVARIQRRQEGQAITELTPDGLAPHVRSYLDSSPQNGVPYAYRLEVELESGARVESGWDEATPGDAVAFVADSEGGGLSRLTPDARDRSFRLGTGRWFLDLAIDTATASVWSVDFLEGQLFQHTFEGGEIQRISVSGARAVEVDDGDGTIWVGSFDLRRLERRGREGDLRWSDDAAGAIEDLLAVPGGGVWLCNMEGELRLYRNGSVLVASTTLKRPVAMTRVTEGTVHVLERGGLRVSRFDLSGLHIGSSAPNLVDPLDLTIDGNGGVWVADPGRGGLVRLDSRLKESAFVPLEGALGVTWDDRDRRLWVAGRFGVQILDSTGQVVSGGIFGPRPIKVELVHEDATR